MDENLKIYLIDCALTHPTYLSPSSFNTSLVSAMPPASLSYTPKTAKAKPHRQKRTKIRDLDTGGIRTYEPTPPRRGNRERPSAKLARKGRPLSSTGASSLIAGSAMSRCLSPWTTRPRCLDGGERCKWRIYGLVNVGRLIRKGFFFFF